MRITLNLASRPYVELRPLYHRLRLLIGLLVVTGFLSWWMLRSEHARAAAAEARVQSLDNAIASVQQTRQRSEAAMRQPANAALLGQAQFLNNLFLRKAFSWTAVMMDLERVLPAGVQVMNIDPQVQKDGHVVIRMRVAGPRERAVDLMRNLEKSSRFLTPRLVGESLQNNQGNGRMQNAAPGAPQGVNFDILADYNPLPTEVKAAKPGAPTGAHRRGRRRQAAKPNPGMAATPAPTVAANPAGAGPR
jgi:type IV pilus assembly protein PilN